MKTTIRNLFLCALAPVVLAGAFFEGQRSGRRSERAEWKPLYERACAEMIRANANVEKTVAFAEEMNRDFPGFMVIMVGRRILENRGYSNQTFAIVCELDGERHIGLVDSNSIAIGKLLERPAPAPIPGRYRL